MTAKRKDPAPVAPPAVEEDGGPVLTTYVVEITCPVGRPGDRLELDENELTPAMRLALRQGWVRQIH